MNNSESSEGSNEDTTNICLMAKDNQQSDEVISKSSICDSSSEFDNSESDDEDLLYNLLLEQSHMITLEYKKCKAKLKAALLENEKLK